MDKNNHGQLELFSPAFKEGERIPDQYTCKGENISPPLNIMKAPQETKSLALVMHDPDAVSGDFAHWLMWDIPANTETINANSVPTGAVQGANGRGEAKYTGPCPPSGTGNHRYMFELYALDSSLSLPSGSSRAELEKAIEGHSLQKFVLTGMYTDGR
jgi:Raf kinase inhibitor-like YbhB/YbcL family protein